MKYIVIASYCKPSKPMDYVDAMQLIERMRSRGIHCHIQSIFTEYRLAGQVARINVDGLNQIAEALGMYHKLGRDHFTLDMLNAWATDAEDNFNNGNGCYFEIRSFDTKSGIAVEISITADGYDIFTSKVLLNNVLIDMDVVINLMDDEIREYLHNLGIYDDDQSFLDAYVEAHKSKFNENFTI